MRLAAAALVSAVAATACGGGSSGEKPPPWVAFSSAGTGTWQVELVRADGTDRRPLTSDSATNLHASWGSADLIAYDSDRAPFPSVWLHDVSRDTDTRLDVGDLRATTPAFSPDGSLVAFEGRAAGSLTGAIYTVPAAGGSPTNLTPEAVPHGNGGPVFSPDGATVYFVSNRDGAYDVYQVPATGGDAVRVTTGSLIVGKPSVSPDGGTLAFARAAASSTEVVLYDLTTQAITPLDVADASEPAFDPRGGRLALRVFADATSHIALVDLSGGTATSTLLTTDAGPDAAPAFAPRGK